jgi:RNA polymerase sigma-70 factor (ECF subfamily)
MSNEKNYRALAENFLETRSEKDYNALYKKVKPGLRSYIYNVVKDNDVTQDILTNTLTKMWTKIDQFDPQYQITTWLYRIAFNECLAHIRQRNRKYSIESMRDYGIEITENSSSRLSADELLVEYHQMTEQDFIDEDNHITKQYTSALECIKQLKPMYREIVEDRLINNMKYEDIAEKYDLPLQTIKNRIRRGKSLIIEQMN